MASCFRLERALQPGCPALKPFGLHQCPSASDDPLSRAGHCPMTHPERRCCLDPDCLWDAAESAVDRAFQHVGSAYSPPSAPRPEPPMVAVAHASAAERWGSN